MGGLLFLNFYKVMPLTECGPVIVNVRDIYYNADLSLVVRGSLVSWNNPNIVLINSFTIQCNGCLYFTSWYMDGKSEQETIDYENVIVTDPYFKLQWWVTRELAKCQWARKASVLESQASSWDRVRICNLRVQFCCLIFYKTSLQGIFNLCQDMERTSQPE